MEAKIKSGTYLAEWPQPPKSTTFFDAAPKIKKNLNQKTVSTAYVFGFQALPSLLALLPILHSPPFKTFTLSKPLPSSSTCLDKEIWIKKHFVHSIHKSLLGFWVSNFTTFPSFSSILTPLTPPPSHRSLDLVIGIF